MGLLTDYFAAMYDAAAKRTLDSGPKATGLSAVEAKSLDPIVTTATLEAILTGTDSMTIIHDNKGALVADGGSDGPWVVSLRPSLIRAIGEPDAQKLAAVAKAWANTEELAGSDPPGLYEFLWNLAHLVQWALGNNQRIYCWMSL